jgi:hypothetical protein
MYTYDNNDQHRVQWGVYIEEGPNYWVISVRILTGLIISGVMVTLWATLTEDVQSALAISSYVVTVPLAWMSSLDLMFSHE